MLTLWRVRRLGVTSCCLIMLPLVFLKNEYVIKDA